ncbi:hypothetical protein [Metaclostridioides mangenotii]|nr:hypothetical protein [Clostridioides mangenotii]
MKIQILYVVPKEGANFQPNVYRTKHKKLLNLETCKIVYISVTILS